MRHTDHAEAAWNGIRTFCTLFAVGAVEHQHAMGFGRGRSDAGRHLLCALLRVALAV